MCLEREPVLTPFQMEVQQVACHGFDVKTDGLQRVAHEFGMATGLAFGTGAALGTQHTSKGKAAATRRLSFHRIQAWQQCLPHFFHRLLAHCHGLLGRLAGCTRRLVKLDDCRHQPHRFEAVAHGACIKIKRWTVPRLTIARALQTITPDAFHVTVMANKLISSNRHLFACHCIIHGCKINLYLQNPQINGQKKDLAASRHMPANS